MTVNNVFEHVAGYDEFLQRRGNNLANGSDFTDQRGWVQTQINALHPHRIYMVVSEIIDETQTAKTIRLRSKDGRALPVFHAGQYVNVFVTVDGVNTARPFAISSAPTVRSHYDLTVRAVPNGFVSPYLLSGLQVGQELTTTGPMGTFHYNPVFHGEDLVFLAGGSGIAPAMSMILAFAAAPVRPRMRLIYGSRSETDIIFRERLKALAAEHDFLTVTEVISEPSPGFVGRSGFLDKRLIQEIVGDVTNIVFFVCGPTPMNDMCLSSLRALGVRPGRIRVEANGPPRCPAHQTGWPQEITPDHRVTVRVLGRGKFTSVSGEPILTALERNGYAAENACRSGECSLCRARLVSGRVFHPPQTKLRASDKKFGWIHSCVAYPLEDVEVDLCGANQSKGEIA
jgi:ferredoxin-NADP reductase